MDTISDNTTGQKPTLGSIERAYADGYAAAQHKIERLRAALQEIADDPGGYPAESVVDDMRAIAREALNPNQSN